MIDGKGRALLTVDSVPPIQHADKHYNDQPTACECYNLLMRMVYKIAQRSMFA